MTRPFASRLVALCALVLAGTAATAGTVDVFVHDDDGAPVRNQSFALHPPLRPGQLIWSLPRATVRRAATDERGRASLTDLAPGQYTLSFRGGVDSALVPPERNPRGAIPQVTLSGERDGATLDVELVRGAPLVLLVELDRPLPLRIPVHMRELDHGFQIESVLDADQWVDEVLVPGRWELTLDLPPGFLLRDIEIEGASIEGRVAVIELEPLRSPKYVRWQLSQPNALLHGAVDFDGPSAPVGIVATLIEPGPWIEQALRYNGSNYERFEAWVDLDTSRYSMPILSGRWMVTPIGDGVTGAEPSALEVVIPADGEAIADFKVQTSEGDGSIIVYVRDEQNEEVDAAAVELWPLDNPGAGEQPFRQARTEFLGRATITGLPPGSYLVVAAIPGLLEGHTPLTGYEPEDERASVTVTLPQAAAIRGIARDEEGGAVPGLTLSMERDGELPQHYITAPDVLESMQQADATTDATGDAWIRGVWPGRYRLTGNLPGAASGTTFVAFHDGADWVEQLTIEIDEPRDYEVQMRMRPAASIGARLYCARQQQMPSTASLVAVSSDVEADQLAGDDWVEETELLVHHVPLSGRSRDALEAGPLHEGTYRVAVRPTGHDRWTWVYDTEHPGGSAIVQALAGEPTDVGALSIDCGPAIRISPRVPEGLTLPDLRGIHPQYSNLTATGEVQVAGDTTPVDGVVVDAYPARVVVRDLPEGEGQVEVRLRHPYFLPEPWVTVTIEQPLERGRTIDVAPEIAGVGGALRLKLEGAAAVEAIRVGDEAVHRSPMVVGEAEIPSLPAGVYRVRACADIDCTEIVRSWDGVTVEVLQTTTPE